MARDNHDQLYTILLNLREDIGRIEQKVDDVKEEVGEVKVQTKITNGRVNALEAFKENMQGRIAIIAILAGLAGTLFVAWMKKQLGI